MTRLFIIVSAFLLFMALLATPIWLERSRASRPTPITDELRAAAHDLGVDFIERDGHYGLLMQAKIIRELARREKTR